MYSKPMRAPPHLAHQSRSVDDEDLLTVRVVELATILTAG
jgi:hypothetical protein